MKQKVTYQGPIDQYGRPLENRGNKNGLGENQRLGTMIFTALGIALILIVIGLFVYNYISQNRLEIPTASLSTTEWTNESVTVTVDQSRGKGNEYSFDDGKTWQTQNTFVVDENQELVLRVRNSKGKVSKPATVIVSNIDKEDPELYFISPYYIQVGSTFDGKLNVSADDLGSGIETYTIDTSRLDMNVPGTYEVSYLLTDLVGNTTKKVRTVVVHEGEKNYFYRSRSVEFGESDCPYECECVPPTDGLCPAGKHVSEDKTQCCETCTEKCEQFTYGNWSEWSSVRMIPSSQLEVEMRME